jgi:hypothetical protein
MNDDRRRDAIVQSWLLGEAPEHAPARLGDLVRDQVADTRQEWPVRPLRLDFRTIRLVGAVVALVLLSMLAGVLIGSPPPAPPASQTPGTTATASPPAPTEVAPSPLRTPGGLVLAAGAVLLQFQPEVSLTVPDGWTLEYDVAEAASLVRPGAGYMIQGDNAFVIFDGIRLFARPVAGRPDGALGGVPGVGTSAEELATWLSKRPQLLATTPTLTTLAGLPAYQLDFELSDEAGDLCGIPCANLLDSGAGTDSYRVGLEGDWRVRAFLVDAPDGSTVLITIDDADAVGFDDEVAAAQPILDSLQFVER